ncbi:hypothetical protein Tco_0750210 [Tanacetum coccineum]|uniref:Uncharacterized protein n=1 Tax=Tanacetum coccineum TaxID=301880 RepID=A0ABQ4Z0N6_9ASTR
MSSRVSNRTVNTTEPPRNPKTFLKLKDLACSICKKCIYSANHDECILKYLSKVNSCASAQKKNAQSHKTTKRYIPVEKKSVSKNHATRNVSIQPYTKPWTSNGLGYKSKELSSSLCPYTAEIEGRKSGGRSSRGVAIQDTPSAQKPKPATSKPKLKGVPDEEKNITKENVILEWGSEQESEYSKEDKLYDEEKDDKEGDADDEGDDHISDTQDTDDEDDELNLMKMISISDEEDSDEAKADAKKTKEAKDDSKKAELPPINSSLYISLDAEIRSLLDITIQSKVPHIQYPSILRVPIYVISEPIVLTPVQETSSAAPLRVAKLEKDASELKNVDHSATTIATLKSQVPTVVYDYLGSKLGDSLQKALHKHSKDLIQKHSVKPAPESSNIKTRTVNLEKGSEKSASEILKINRDQAEKQKTPKFRIKSTDKVLASNIESNKEVRLLRILGLGQFN